MAKSNTPALFISATQKTNVEAFKETLYEEIKTIHSQRFPYNDFLYDSDWETGEQ
jgi:GTP-binding protein HflX